jgi:hypothetical protein
MRLTETVTIYLATGAPFGVNHFLRQPLDQRRPKAVLRAAAAILLWPFAVALILLARVRREDRGFGAGKEPPGNPQRLEPAEAGWLERVSASERELLDSVESLRERGQESLKRPSELEPFTRALRDTIEQYVGLSLAHKGLAGSPDPAPRDMELCRVAGRSGADLLLAGRCIQRRNASRIVEHKNRARTQLLDALAEVCQFAPSGPAAAPNIDALRLVRIELIRVYRNAIALLSLLEDEGLAIQVARLMDAECAKLRRLGFSSFEGVSPEPNGDSNVRRTQQWFAQG